MSSGDDHLESASLPSLLLSVGHNSRLSVFDPFPELNTASEGQHCDVVDVSEVPRSPKRDRFVASLLTDVISVPLGPCSSHSEPLTESSFDSILACVSTTRGPIALFPLSLNPGGKNGEELSNVSHRTMTLSGHQGQTNRLCSLPESRIASGGWDKTVRVWDCQSHSGRVGTSRSDSPLLRCFDDGHDDIVSCVEFWWYGNGNRLFSASRDKTVLGWDLLQATETPVVSFRRSHVNSVVAMDVAQKAGVLYSAGFDCSVRLYDLRTEEAIGMIQDTEFYEPMYSLRVVEDQSLVVTGGVKGNVSVYDMRMLEEKSTALKRIESMHGGIVTDIEWIEGSRYFVSTGFSDSCLKVWDVDSGLVRKEWTFQSPQIGVAFAGSQRSRHVSLVSPIQEVEVEGENAETETETEGVSVDQVKKSKGLQDLESRREEISDEVETIEINDTLDVDQQVFLKLLLGVPVQIPPDKLLDYFALFRHLKLRKRAYLVCRRLERLRNLATLLDLLQACMRKYETEPQEEGRFQCAFSLASFEVLRSRLPEVLGNHVLMEQVKAMGISEKLQGFEPTPLHLHENFAFSSEEDCPSTFRDVSRETLRTLWKTKKHYNVIIRPARGGTFVSHLEILIWRLNFFYRELRAGGSDRQEDLSMKQFVVEYLSPFAVHSLLEFVYLEEVSTEDVKVILELLLWNDGADPTLMRHLADRLRELSRAVIESGDGKFEEWLRLYGVELRQLQQSSFVGGVIMWWSLFKGWTQDRIREILESVEEHETVECPLFGDPFRFH